jgi:hypothetical protein
MSGFEIIAEESVGNVTVAIGKRDRRRYRATILASWGGELHARVSGRGGTWIEALAEAEDAARFVDFNRGDLVQALCAVKDEMEDQTGDDYPPTPGRLGSLWARLFGRTA